MLLAQIAPQNNQRGVEKWSEDRLCGEELITQIEEGFSLSRNQDGKDYQQILQKN